MKTLLALMFVLCIGTSVAYAVQQGIEQQYARPIETFVPTVPCPVPTSATGVTASVNCIPR